MRCGERVSADGVRRPIAVGVAAPAFAQRVSLSAFGGDGGVVRMDDGAVTFKGGSISNSTAVRVCAKRESRVCAPWYGTLRGAARPMDGAHGAAHACCGEWCTVYGACGRSGASEYDAPVRYAMCMLLHRRALRVASARVGSEQ